MKSFILFVFSFTICVSQLFSQRVVSGYVTAFDDLSLGNIKVEAKKAGSAVRTDSTGYFLIVTKEKDVLVFDSKVFNKKRVRINKKTKDSLKVNLRFLDTPQNRDMAVGYGYVKKSDLTYAVSQMERDQNNFCSYTDIFELIKGRFPGVMVTGGSGEPEVIVRGKSSFTTSNCALYVVDGMVVQSISTLPPCQIKSISVLKDAASSIYGSRGANGVILIETIK